MDATTIFIVALVSIVAGLGFLGAMAIRFGADSRPTLGDDHAR